MTQKIVNVHAEVQIKCPNSHSKFSA